jgi:hypothetical protein
VQTPDKEKFLTLFYQTFMKGLMAPVMDVDVKDKEITQAEAELKPARRQELCELLAYCCQHHGYHIKYFTLGNNIAAKVAKLLSSTQPKHVALGTLATHTPGWCSAAHYTFTIQTCSGAEVLQSDGGG